jgi:prepilin-type N-terminal cleavage/methylation domain-containing protein
MIFHNRRGFTLVEMLIVVALITIIIGIALPRFAGVTGRARQAEANGELKTIQSAIEGLIAFGATATPPACGAANVGINNVCVFTPLSGQNPRIIGATGEYIDPFQPAGAVGDVQFYQYRALGRFYFVASRGPNQALGVLVIGATGQITGAEADDIIISNGIVCPAGAGAC